MRKIEYSKVALEFLKKISRKEAMRIMGKIRQYAESPNDLQNNVKKMQEYGLYRLRIGRYRVIFDEDGFVLSILKIGFRQNIYKEL